MINYLETNKHNIAWFRKINDEKSLILKPAFQRNLIWTDKQKSFLIDSILEGYPIPELYMQEIVDANGYTKQIVVDGQQRITSVLQFIEGSLRIESSESTKWGGLRFDDLSDEQRKQFFSYSFVIRMLPEIPEEQIRSIFQRINKNNIRLNDQELRQSTYWGEFINTMNDISNLQYWEEIDIFSIEKIRRMVDVEYISELVISFLHGHQNKKDKLNYYYQYYEENGFDEALKVKGLFNTVLGEILQILPDIKKTRWNNLSDFYTLFLVLANRVESIPFSSDIRAELYIKLISFGRDVDTRLKTSEQEDDVKESGNVDIQIITYAKNIRASTDLRSRKARFDALDEYLFSTVNKTRDQ